VSTTTIFGVVTNSAAAGGPSLGAHGGPGRKGGDVQVSRGRTGMGRALAFAGVFAAALAAGAVYPLCFIYAAKLSLFFLIGEWSWSPVHPAEPVLADVLAAALTAGPLALLSAALLPIAALLSVTRPCLGRFLVGRHPYLGCEEIDPEVREALRSALEGRLGSTVVLDPPAHQGARLARFVSGLVLFCCVFGGAS
jgi:hypothetical protein